MPSLTDEESASRDQAVLAACHKLISDGYHPGNIRLRRILPNWSDKTLLSVRDHLVRRGLLVIPEDLHHARNVEKIRAAAKRKATFLPLVKAACQELISSGIYPSADKLCGKIPAHRRNYLLALRDELVRNGDLSIPSSLLYVEKVEGISVARLGMLAAMAKRGGKCASHVDEVELKHNAMLERLRNGDLRLHVLNPRFTHDQMGPRAAIARLRQLNRRAEIRRGVVA